MAIFSFLENQLPVLLGDVFFHMRIQLIFQYGGGIFAKKFFANILGK